MRAFLTCAILTAAVLTVIPAPAQAQTISSADLVDSWYTRYLGRHVDPVGLADQTRALQRGVPVEAVEAGILSSTEYYLRSGSTPEGFVAALYRDVLGRRPTGHELNRDVNRALTLGRGAVASQILNERALASAPVVVAPAPVIVARPYVVESTVIVPAHRHGPVYVSPRPAISLRFNFGR